MKRDVKAGRDMSPIRSWTLERDPRVETKVNELYTQPGGKYVGLMVSVGGSELLDYHQRIGVLEAEPVLDLLSHIYALRILSRRGGSPGKNLDTEIEALLKEHGRLT